MVEDPGGDFTLCAKEEERREDEAAAVDGRSLSLSSLWRRWRRPRRLGGGGGPLFGIQISRSGEPVISGGRASERACDPA